MTANQPSHDHTNSQSTAYSQDVDSAATTLLGSGGSFEVGRKYADIELDRFESRQRKHVEDHERAKVADDDSEGDSAYASSEDGRDEDEQDGLLNLPSTPLRPDTQPCKYACRRQ